MSVSLIAYPCSWSFYFLFYEKFKDIFQDYTDYHSVNNVLSASLAGFISTLITSPLWLIRVRMQVQSSNRTSALALSKIFYQGRNGILSLYRGITASLMGVAHVAIYFPLYELCKSKLHNDNAPKPLQIMMCSSIPKVIASVFSYPHEVIRARLFIHDKADDKRFNGLRGLIRYTYKSEGFRGFYGGFCA